ncbi:MAG TPA: glycosyltransferase family 2 protein [Steroidobacteraceae bacterium]
MTINVSVCIATYRRIERLREVLQDLSRQQRLPDQVVVVDNDAAGSARPVVEQFRTAATPFRLDYDIQPERNIALTRNRTVELANGDWLAFIDDDERAPEDWLSQLLAATERYRADGVLAPVQPQVPPSAPSWIRRGRFYDFPRLPSGTTVPLHRMRFGNVVLRGSLLRSEPGPFDPSYGLTTGEDGDLLVRLARRGASIVWCDEAIVWEPIEAKRLSLRWLLVRALTGGQEFARQTLNGRYGPITHLGHARLFLRASAQLIAAGGLAATCWPAGRHVAAAWLVKASANVGKLTAFWGARHRSYA